MRWVNLSIPPGSTITKAWIQFSAKEAQSEVTNLDFFAQAADAAPTFSGNKNDIGARPRTSSVVTWSPPAWTAGQIGAGQQTPDLKSIIQEVVSRPGWKLNNPLAVIVNGTGHRTAWAWDGNALQAPLLHVEYTGGTPPPDSPPVGVLAVSQAASPALTVNASAAGSTDTDTTPIASYSFDWGDGTTASVVTAPTQTASHTYASAGAYTVTLTVKDTGGLTSVPVTRSVTVSPASAITFESRIAASSDDAEQQVANGSVYLTSSDLELINDSVDQVVGMRWPVVSVPQGATITAAWIQFVSKEAWSLATSLTLKAQAADNAGTFTSTTSNVSSRPVTNNGASWVPVAWAVGDAGANQRTPDLSGLVQEVVNRSGWASGNGLAIVVTGTGHRTAWAYDGSPTQAPLLHIEYTSNGSQPPPTDNPPVAKLAVSQASSPALTVNASASGSTDTDSTPIASYTFGWGDGSSATVVNAPTVTATHTYASAGTYTVTLTAKDTGGLTSSQVSSSITVNPPSGGGGVAVYVGYYDTHHPSNLKTKPNPWLGSPGVTFVGKDDDGKGNWDSAALRVDNPTSSSISVTVTCDIGSNHYALWGSRTIPANGTLILAQTAFQNFDGSDTSPAGCYGCDPKLCLTKVVSTIPVIHVTVGSTTTNYYDNTQVLNTKGADGAGCPDTGGTRNDESQQWKQIGTTQSLRDGDPSDENWVPQQMTFDAPAPNPVKSWMVIRYSIPKTSRVFVGFYDVAGRLVSIVLDREMPAGIYQQGVTLGNVSSGVYYCQVQTSYGSVHRSVVVSR
jgi:PKD repeat protein